MVNVFANRSSSKWTKRELVGRILWTIIAPSFALSPRPFWAWRRMILRLFGARIGQEVHIYPSVRIAIPWNLEIGDYSAVGAGAQLYSLGRIVLGREVTVSQGAHLCAGTHDWRDPTMPLLKPPIEICDGAWICAEAFIGPGITIGNRAIVGARAVVFKDVGNDSIVVGNPAVQIKTRI